MKTCVKNNLHVSWAMALSLVGMKCAILLNRLSQPHFEASVRMKLTLPKVEAWSPSRLLEIQSLIARDKTPRIEVFFILLERFGRVDVQNGLA